MSRRSAPGSLLGALFVVGVVGWVLSQIWVYLVLAGTLALLGWVAWVLSRTFKMQAPRAPRLVSVEAPRSAPAPENQFCQVAPVDPNAFNDPARSEIAAMKTFAAWSRGLPMAPSDSSALVRSLELRVRHIGRLVSRVAERKVTWCAVPYAGGAPIGSPRITAETVDCWGMGSDMLRSASHYIAGCDRCTAAGEVVCPSCSGTTKARCAACSGAGKAYGFAKNGSRRLMNCKVCRGKAEIQCTACAKGRVTCSCCGGSGRIARWLEVLETVRTDVQVEPDGNMTRAFAWGTDGAGASRSEVEADARIQLEFSSPNGPLSYSEILPSIGTTWMNAHWQELQPILRPGERVLSQTLWYLDVPSIELSYGLPGAPATVISFEGRRMLAPPNSLDRHFATRAQRIRLVRYVLLGLSATIPLAYLVRGSYFWNGWIACLALSVVGLAAAVDGLMRRATLGRRGIRIWAACAATASVLATVSAVAAEPSAGVAKRHIAAGRLDAAKIELNALGKPSVSSHADAWAELHLAETMKLNDAGAIAQIATLIPTRLPQRATVNRRLFGVLSETVNAQITNRKATDAEILLAQVAPALNTAGSGEQVETDLAELRARVHDEKFSECADDTCRWKAALDANRAATSRGRQQRLASARSKIVEAVTARPQPKDPPLLRVQRIDAVAEAANALVAMEGDMEVSAMAREAAIWAAGERAKFAILGAERSVAAVLMRTDSDGAGSTIATTYRNVAAYCSVRAGRCTGMYIVGAAPRARVLNDGAHSAAATQALSQALGHQAELPDPPKNVTSGTRVTSKWRDGNVLMVATWRGSDLMELRLGDARP